MLRIGKQRVRVKEIIEKEEEVKEEDEKPTADKRRLIKKLSSVYNNDLDPED